MKRLFLLLLALLALIPLRAARADILVSESGTGRILRFASVSGDYLGAFAAGLSFPEGLSYAADGSVYVCEYYNRDVVHLMPDGTRDPALPNGVLCVIGPALDSTVHAMDVTVGPGGDIFVTGARGQYSTTLNRYRPDGTLVWAFEASTVRMVGVRSGPDGQLYVADETANVFRMDPDHPFDAGLVSVLYISPNGLEEVAFDSAGALYTSCLDASILRVPSPGVFSQFYLAPQESDGGRRPFYGIDFDANDDLIACQNSTGKVFRIHRDGTAEIMAQGLSYPSWVTCPKPTSPPDTTAPATTATLDPAPTVYGWNNSPVTVTLHASDEAGGSGVKQIVYRLDVGAPQTVDGDTATVDVSGEVFHTVFFYAVDNNGNTEVEHSKAINIDMTPPSISGAPDRQPDFNGWYNAPVTVTFTADDPWYSGIASVTDPILLITDGINVSATGTATDKAGNTATTTVSGLNIDLTKPVTTATAQDGKPGKVTLSATDNLSGVVATYYAVDGGAATLYTTPLGIGQDGVHTVEYWSVDNAGNEETHQSVTVTVGAAKLADVSCNVYTYNWGGIYITEGHVKIVNSGSSAATNVRVTSFTIEKVAMGERAIVFFDPSGNAIGAWSTDPTQTWGGQGIPAGGSADCAGFSDYSGYSPFPRGSKVTVSATLTWDGGTKTFKRTVTVQ